MKELLLMIFTAYFITIVLVLSTVLDVPRNLIIKYTQPLAIGGIHTLQCRFCTGFWVSLAVVVYHQQYAMFPIVAGVSYFLAKQERGQ